MLQTPWLRQFVTLIKQRVKHNNEKRIQQRLVYHEENRLYFPRFKPHTAVISQRSVRCTRSRYLQKKDEPVVFNPMVISATLSDKSIEEIPGTLHLFDKEKSGYATYAVPVTSCRKHQASISGEPVRAARRPRQIAATVFRSAESQVSQERWFCWTTRK